MGKFLELVGMVVVMVVVGALVRGYMKNSAGRGQSNTMSKSDIVYATSRETNKSLPMMVDSETRLDTTQATHGGTKFTYKYTMVNFRSSDVDRAAFRSDVFPQIKSNVCHSADMARIFKLGVSVVYSYSGNDGVEFDRLELSPMDCGY